MSISEDAMQDGRLALIERGGLSAVEDPRTWVIAVAKKVELKSVRDWYRERLAWYEAGEFDCLRTGHRRFGEQVPAFVLAHREWRDNENAIERERVRNSPQAQDSNRERGRRYRQTEAGKKYRREWMAARRAEQRAA